MSLVGVMNKMPAPAPLMLRALSKYSKRGDEVVVVEEEDTTRELRRLESALSRVMKQIKVNIAPAMLVFDVGDWSSS